MSEAIEKATEETAGHFGPVTQLQASFEPESYETKSLHEALDAEVDYDWLCDDCRNKHPDMDVDDLKAICIHCVRVLQARAGVDPDSFENGESDMGRENDE